MRRKIDTDQKYTGIGTADTRISLSINLHNLQKWGLGHSPKRGEGGSPTFSPFPSGRGLGLGIENLLHFYKNGLFLQADTGIGTADTRIPFHLYFIRIYPNRRRANYPRSSYENRRPMMSLIRFHALFLLSCYKDIHHGNYRV